MRSVADIRTPSKLTIIKSTNEEGDRHHRAGNKQNKLRIFNLQRLEPGEVLKQLGHFATLIRRVKNYRKDVLYHQWDA